MASSVGPDRELLAKLLQLIDEDHERLGLFIPLGDASSLTKDIILSKQVVDGKWCQGGWYHGQWKPFNWGKHSYSSVPNSNIDGYEINVDEVFCALDRQQGSDSGLLSQSDRVLDFLWLYMGLAEAFSYMSSSPRLRDHLIYCFPLWSRIVCDLQGLTSDAVFHLPTQIAHPATLLYQFCAKVLREVRPAPSLKYEVALDPFKSIKLKGELNRIKAFPEIDLVGVLTTKYSSDHSKKRLLEVFALSRISNGIAECVMELDGDWLVKDFFICDDIAVFWLGGLDGTSCESDWTPYSPIVSIPMNQLDDDGGREVTKYASPLTSVHLISANKDYIVAVIRDKGSMSHNQELYIWPRQEGCQTYKTDPAIQSLDTFISDLAIHGTSLATLSSPLRWNNIRNGFASYYPTQDLRRPRMSQPVQMVMINLGPPNEFGSLFPLVPQHMAYHREDTRLIAKGSFSPRLHIINSKSPYHARNPTDSELWPVKVASEVLIESGDDYMRVGPFASGSHSFGQLYHLDDPFEGPHSSPLQYTVQDVKNDARTPVFTFPVNHHIRDHCFAGHSILYCDGYELILRRFPIH